jgi:hypothetical protein
MSVPHGRWKAATFIAGLRARGVVAPFVIDCPVIAPARREAEAAGRSARSVIAPRSVQIPARSGCRLAGM